MCIEVDAAMRPHDHILDDGIKKYVELLQHAGIETCESCQGGVGHAFPVPTIRFLGDRSEGWRALAIAQQADFPLAELRRVWPILDGEPAGPVWEITFHGD